MYGLRMELSKYMHLAKLDDRAMADKIEPYRPGTTRVTVSRLRRGKANPSLAMMDIISVVSQGAVKREDWPTPINSETEAGAS